MSFWHRILRAARFHPILAGISIGILLLLFTFVLDFVIGRYENQLSYFLRMVESSANIFGWFAIMGGYTFALLAWAHRKEAAISFYGAGNKVEKLKDSFDASLILGSQHAQTEWHLRHIKPKRVEVVWTPMVEEHTRTILQRFTDIEWLDSRQRSLENEDVYDIAIVKKHCMDLLRNMLFKYDADKICVDLTAGTALMTVAAFQAAEELGVTSLYLVGETIDGKRGRLIDNDKVDNPKEAKVVIVSDHRK